jgi:hypothetical protein
MPEVRRINIDKLSRQLKNQANFLKWMARRYAANEEQAAAFTTGAGLISDIRTELKDGDYDAGAAPSGLVLPADEEELFTSELTGSQVELLDELVQDSMLRSADNIRAEQAAAAAEMEKYL